MHRCSFRLFLFAAVFAAAFTISGCGFTGRTISGSAETVVTEAQNLAVDEKARVEVTGNLSDNAYGSDTVKEGDLSADLWTKEAHVLLIFKGGITAEQAEIVNGGRFTAVGELDGRNDSGEFITLPVDEIR